MSSASAPIEIRGRYFWRGKERFLIRGIVYQDHNIRANSGAPDRPPHDPIADDCLEQLTHDVELFKELGVNTLLVYGIDNQKCHDQAMKMLEEAGIYVLATLATAFRSINRLQPEQSYNTEMLSHFFRSADVLSAYPNCFGLLVGNEVVNDNRSLRALPVVRAVVRDVKRYLKLKDDITGQRVPPLGYSSADVKALERGIRDYLSAGDKAERIDFWSKNDFSWASPSDMQISGYNNQIKSYSDFNIPAFFSEYGTNTNPPRDFGETSALLSPEMTHVFSGGIAYEFWRGSNMYGIVERVAGIEASKWRNAHKELQRARAEGGLSRAMAKMTFGEYARSIEKGGSEFEDEQGRIKMLSREIAEYRETSMGEILIYQDFINLRERLKAMKDVEATTDPNWVDDEVTAARAPEFPKDEALQNLEVPPTCVDWQAVEEKIRNEAEAS